MNRVKSVNRVFLITVFASLIGSIINGWIEGTTGNIFLVLLVSQVILVLPSMIYLVSQRINVFEAIRFKKIRISNVILIVIFSYAIMPLMNLINAISMLFVKNDTSDIMFTLVQENGFLISLFMVAFIPCVFEEFVYRGVIYNTYSKVSPLKGIILSGFLFGIIHGNLNQFSYAFTMGIVFALLIEATDSILSTMIVHFIINGTSVVIISLYPILLKTLEALYGSEQFNADELMQSLNTGVEETLSFGYIIQSLGLSALVGAILAFIIFKTIAKNTGRWDYVKSLFRKRSKIEQTDALDRRLYDYDEEGYASNDTVTSYDNSNKGKYRLVTASLLIAIAICIGLMVLNEVWSADITEQPLEEFYTVISNYFNG
jgi:hypothetical protein